LNFSALKDDPGANTSGRLEIEKDLIETIEKGDWGENLKELDLSAHFDCYFDFIKKLSQEFSEVK